VVLGLGVEYAFPTVLGKLLPLRPEIRLPVNPVLAALGTGILTTLLFCLPPLLDVRNVRPSLVLRRVVESGNGAGWIGLAEGAQAAVGSVVVILAGLGGIAAALSDSMLVGKWFAICLAGLLVFILGLSAGHCGLLRAFLSRTRLHLNSALRHGLANLYRPGNQSSAVLAALGTGVMLILSVFLMQRSIVNALHEDVKPDTPNLFLIDMSTQELPGIRAELAKQAGVIGDLEAVPIVSARVESIDGTAVDDLKIQELSETAAAQRDVVVGRCCLRERRSRKGSGGLGPAAAILRWWIMWRSG
jgi:putative ABC transport system permease protein